jgi:phosphoserine phosphatase RsbU/P
VSEPKEDRERLRRIEAVTDQALAHLDVDVLLHELLLRVCDVLGADTASVLLLDEETNDLVATAAHGLEEEVRQGVRIPVGKGFAGKIAATGEPAVIEHVDETNVINPILLKLGIRSLLGAPLVVSGRISGVLHVGTLRHRQFDENDIHLIQMVADRVALATENRRTKAERAAATALQRSLLPARLPRVNGLELAARYLPGDVGGVGGDWYDVFSLPDGRSGIAIGDVVGRGLRAATVMGRLRSALRAYALESPDPAEVLTRLDRKAQHFEAGQMTTVLYLVVEPGTTYVTLSSAGHLLPLLARPDGTVATVEMPVDPPLGVLRHVSRRNTRAKLAEGSTMFLFTDGLVERRDTPLTESLEELRTIVTAAPPSTLCEVVLSAMLGDHGAPDDIALLALRRTQPPSNDDDDHSGTGRSVDTGRRGRPAAGRPPARRQDKLEASAN